MASRPKQADPRPAPRLYLVTPPVADAPAFSAPLAAALGAGDVAAVLLRLAEADERTQINRAKTLVPVVQDKGAALLLDGHADLVARAGADGAHLTGIEAFTAALQQLKPERIVGARRPRHPPRRHDRGRGGRRLRDVRRAGRGRRTAELRGDRGARRLVGGSVRGPLRRLCRVGRRSGAAGEGRRRFRRARRLAVARSAGDCRSDCPRRRALRLPESAA